jgi:hypothetical protein
MDLLSSGIVSSFRWQKWLTQPLRIHLVEEVDDRVSKTVEEVFMDKGKSGWEGR